MRFDVVVIGAGAAGMMCAAEAGLRGRRVLLIEHAPIIGERIRISGGGRCNFTNRDVSPANFLSRNPDFCRSALARFTAQDFIARIEQRGIRYHEKTLGQLFCDDSSRQVIDLLVDAVADAGVQWAHPCAVHRFAAIFSEPHDRFELVTDLGTVRCASIVVATGGLAVPKLGATPFGYRLAEQFGLRVVAPRAGLVPLALPPELLTTLAPISGVSLDAETGLGPRGGAHWVTSPKPLAAQASPPSSKEGASAFGRPGGAHSTREHPRFREKLLVTHRGLSGPAILQISSYWQMADRERTTGPQPDVTVDLLPGDDAAAWLASHAHSGALLSNLLAERLPRSFAQGWCALHDCDKPVAELGSQQRERIGATLNRWPISPSGTLGFGKAEVTLGGIDTDELSSKTMESRAVPGLYFIGEVVDVTGWLGGYNFQWAWSSGWVAGQFA